MKVLSISDKIVSFIYSPHVIEKFGQVDFVIACGDLPYYYQEYIISSLDVPFFFVRGNHDPKIEMGEAGARSYPLGGVDLHRRVVRWNQLILAGVEGCLRYTEWGNFQYTQSQMWLFTISLVPRLLWNRLVHGRALDIFITHVPPWGIHDRQDLAHQGAKAFAWLLRVFQPAYHFHGHVHLYRPDTPAESLYKNTRVINTYGYRETTLPDL